MDPVANMLTSLVTAQRMGKERVAVPYSRFKEKLASLLKEKKVIAAMRVQEGAKPKIVITLAYEKDEPMIRVVRRLSSPGQRRYVTKGELPWAGGRPGFYVVSTSSGLMDEAEARQRGLGGELVCEVWQ